HHRTHADPQPGEVRDRADEERGGVRRAVTGEPLDVRQTGSVVDGGVQVLPAALLRGARPAEALAAAAAQPAEFFAVDVHERALGEEAMPERMRPARRNTERGCGCPQRCARLDALDQELATEWSELATRVGHLRALLLLREVSSPHDSVAGSLFVHNLYGQLS